MADKILLHPELETWLRRAVVDLIPSAQEAVRDEISGHFEDAVRGRDAAGFTDSEAIDLALRELGSPRRANRRLCKEWLTQAEYESIQAIAKRRRENLPSLKHSFGVLFRIFSWIWIAIAVLCCYTFAKFGRGAWPNLFPIVLIGIPLLLVYYRSMILLVSRFAGGFFAAELISNAFVCFCLLDMTSAMLRAHSPSAGFPAGILPWLEANSGELVIGLYTAYFARSSIAVPARLWLKCRKVEGKHGNRSDSIYFPAGPLHPDL